VSDRAALEPEQLVTIAYLSLVIGALMPICVQTVQHHLTAAHLPARFLTLLRKNYHPPGVGFVAQQSTHRGCLTAHNEPVFGRIVWVYDELLQSCDMRSSGEDRIDGHEFTHLDLSDKSSTELSSDDALVDKLNA
jgi:hypothetical protein